MPDGIGLPAACGMGNVLIEIDGGIGATLCAEPAIRSFKSEAGNNAEITVRAGHEDLFYNHPGISTVANIALSGDDESFGVRFRLDAGLAAGQDWEGLIDGFAEQLGVSLADKCPRLYLNSFDYVRMQRFKIGSVSHPRVVIAAGHDSGAEMWNDDNWRQLCQALETAVSASILQIGGEGDVFFGHGMDLTGKVTAREAATIISKGDLLVGVDNGYGQLAGAVKTPAVIICVGKDCVRQISQLTTAGENGSEDDVTIDSDSGDSDGGDGGSRGEISVATVIENIVQLCGKA